jgi:NADH dehydrogenase
VGEGFVIVGAERIDASNVFWAAGVTASPVGTELGAPVDREGRVRVASDCSLPGHPEVFVVGDLASVVQEDGTPVPGVAQGAIQMGRHVAKTIRNDLLGRPRSPFRYVDRGDLATIGRAAAVARLGRVHVSGLLAWLIWVGVHIFYLIGFRNRLIVMIQWAWAYVMYQRGIRLITGDGRPDLLKSRAREQDGHDYA